MTRSARGPVLPKLGKVKAKRPTRLLVPTRRIFRLGDSFKVAIEVGVVLVSEMNAREHWRPKAARKAQQRAVVGAALRGLVTWRWDGAADLRIDITRIAPKNLDRGDGMIPTAKATKDEIASFLGVDDNDPRLDWRVGWERGAPKTWGCRIEIREVTKSDRIAELERALEEAKAEVASEAEKPVSSKAAKVAHDLHSMFFAREQFVLGQGRKR